MNLNLEKRKYEQLILHEKYMMIENVSIDFMVKFGVDFSTFQNIIKTFYENIFTLKQTFFKGFVLNMRRHVVTKNNDPQKLTQDLFGTNIEHNEFMFDWIENVLNHNCPLEIVENSILIKENNHYYLSVKKQEKKKKKKGKTKV